MSRMFSFLLGTFLGIYEGLFVAQNIEVPKVPGPVAQLEKVKQFFSGDPEKSDKKGK